MANCPTRSTNGLFCIFEEGTDHQHVFTAFPPHIPTTEEARVAHQREEAILEKVRPIYRLYDEGKLTWEEFKAEVEADILVLLP